MSLKQLSEKLVNSCGACEIPRLLGYSAPEARSNETAGRGSDSEGFLFLGQTVNLFLRLVRGAVIETMDARSGYSSRTGR